MKNLTLILVAAFAMLALRSTGMAQYAKEKHFIGPHIGLSGVGSTFSFGGDYEYGVTENIGVGALLDYWSYDFGSFGFTSGYSYRYIAIGAIGSYHFLLTDKKWDPFLGLGLGYYIVSVTTPAGGITTGLDDSRLFLGAQGGIRYFFSPKIAAQARLGFGAYIIAVGVDFKF